MICVLVLWTAGSGGVAFPAHASPEDPDRALARAVGASEEITITLPGEVPLVMVRISAGTFTMGSPDSESGRSTDEGPQHQVTISEDFYLGKYEVTQAQWQALMGSPLPTQCDIHSVGNDYPVYCVSWDDIHGTGPGLVEADGFLEKLNNHLAATGQPGGGKLRLPTEAEWEYAARAGTTTRFSFGDALECGDPCRACTTYEQSMWWCGNAYYNTSTRGPRPVGQKLANPWGLFDMHGNVWEWVGDAYSSYGSSPQIDPSGPTWGSQRVVRGGSWGFWASNSRAARRGSFMSAGYRYHYVGFRLARSL